MTMITPITVEETKYTKEEYDNAIATKDVVVNSWKNLAEKYLKDSNIIKAALLNEALERDWCYDYNSFIDDINKQTEFIKLDRAESEYEVEVEVTRTQTQHIVITLTAANYDSAVDDFNFNQEDYANEYIDEDRWKKQSIEYEVKD